MARPPVDNVAQLVTRARYALATAHPDLPGAVGSSKRTMQRWQAAESRPSDSQLADLARLAHPLDAELAAGLAHAAGATLESLGIVPPKSPPPPVLPPMPRHLVVDAVVCAAADATDAAPSAVRAILLAAFKRARELGLSTDEVEKALAERTASGMAK
jgi:hypothetical protein